MGILKKIVVMCLFLGISFLVFPSRKLEANSGPPSNLGIEIANFDEEYYLDIFIYHELPLSEAQINQAMDRWLEPSDEHSWLDYYYQDEYPPNLITFRDQDGFVSTTLYGGLNHFYSNNSSASNHDIYVLFLFVPREFKIVLTNAEGHIIISDLIIMEQYDYTITYDLEGISFDENIQYGVGKITGLIGDPFLRLSTWFHIAVRLITTLIVELGLLYIFMFRKKKTYLVSGSINILTQLILSIGILYFYYLGNLAGYLDPIFFFIIGEFVIFVIEMITYTIFIKEKSVMRRILAAFIGNLASMFAGLFVSAWLLSWLAY
jgi:hypothetical protein